MGQNTLKINEGILSESFGLVRSCFRGPPPFGLTLIGLPENFQLDLSYLDLDYLHLDLGSLQKKEAL